MHSDEAGTDPSPGRRNHLLMGLVLVLMLVPIWSFRYFPSSDGGAHVANADVLLHYFTSDSTSAYHTYYRLNLRPIPNTAGHLALAALLTLFSPMAEKAPPLAEKALVSLIVFLFPLSLGYAARGFGPRAGYLAWLALPLSISFMLHEGFYNFCLGICAFFLLIGYWMRYREDLTLGRVLILAILGLLVYFCHLFAIVMGCLAIGILAACFTLAEAWAGSSRGTRLWSGIRSRCVLTLVALAPAMALAVGFRFVARPEAAVRQTAWLDPAFWKNLVGMGILFSYRRPELFVGAGLAALLLVVIGRVLAVKIKRRQYGPCDGLLLFAVALGIVYFMKADRASHLIFLPERLILFIWIALILWLAAQGVQRWHKRLLGVGAAVAAIALSAMHYYSYAQANVQLAEYVTAARQITPGSTLLPLLFTQCGWPPCSDMKLNRPAVMPFYSSAGYATASLRAVDLRNYEAGVDYFPVCFREQVNPFDKLAVNNGADKGFNDLPQKVDILDYHQRTGGRAQADYVLLFAAPELLDAPLRDNPDTLSIERQLAQGYVKVYTSTPRHLAQLWQRKDFGQ